MLCACLLTTASILPGFPEMIVLVAVGLLLFGRDLPTVGRKVGKTIVDLRQGLQRIKDEIAMDDDLSEVRESVRNIGDDVRGVRAEVTDSVRDAIDVPEEVTAAATVLKNPESLFEGLTDETASSEGPAAPEQPAESVPESAAVEDKPAGPSPFLQAARKRRQ